MRSPDEIKRIIKSDSYQVFLFTCPANIPGFRHPWFVLNKKGKLTRWEVLFEKNNGQPGWRHLHNNLFAPFAGISRFPYSQKLLRKARLEGYTNGGDAKKIIDFIEKSPDSYQFRDYYRFFGPNSNTYAQWVLDHNPKFKVSLPDNSLGKDYHL
ncbi:MAG TPA: DUF3750 domain-containing protein [Candidatus Saccharimonadales bacterium]|nr:DUF3750 domain-containing protein [Candidatus Saccharimonadales bacterium]